MSEHETDPQRPEEPEGTTPAQEPSDEQPTVQQPAAAMSGPSNGSPAPQPPSWASQSSPWQPHPSYPYGQYPGYGQPGYHQPYAAPAWAAAPGQGSSHSSPQSSPPAELPGGAPFWVPGGAEQATPGGAEQSSAPSWVAPVGGGPERDPERARRGRRIFVGVAAALLIALASGGIGAATAVALDKNNGTAAVKTGNSSITRVVDRSSLAQIAAAVQDSVVSITTESGEGSGVILSADGDILTNNHVVATAQGNTVQVIFANGKKATATIVGTDSRTDLAVIKASGVSGLKPATFGDSSQMQVGDTVLALGSPLGLEGSVTAGIISAKDRTIQSSDQNQTPQNPFGGGNGNQSASPTTTMSGLLQTDAPINPGNSGGALVNTNGQVIGINSAIATSGQNSGNIGLGFAIPSNKAKTVANDLLAGKKVSHPALGVSVSGAEGGGALVGSVTANSAAAKAGLQQGDVITSVDGKPVNDSDDLVGIIQSANVGDSVTIKFTRNGEQKTVTATLEEAG